MCTVTEITIPDPNDPSKDVVIYDEVKCTNPDCPFK